MKTRKKLNVWLAMSMFLLAMACATAAGGTIYVDADATGANDGSHRVGELRIIAWNIEHLGWREPLRTQEQIDAIAERILTFDAAVLAVQEISEGSVFKYVRSQMGPSWKIYDPGGAENAFLYDETKVELLSAEIVSYLENPPYTLYPGHWGSHPVTGVFRPAGTQGTELFRVIGVHCMAGEPQTRAAEGEWLRKKIVEFLNDPRETNDIILLGDLNGEPPGGAPHPQLQQGGYIYLLPKENGDDTHVGGGRIDHFYVTETARDKIPKESSFVIRPEHYGETPWEFKETYSDHYPISIDIDFVWSSTGAGRPIPADGAFGLSTDVVLRWTAGTKAESHDVYFGTDEAAVVAATPSSPEFKANQTDTTYPLAELEMETTYYWRIDEVNDADTWTGDTWSFTTGKVYYVDADAEGANDGSSWADGFNDLQDALATAQYGDEVRVAQGVYKPTELAPPPPPKLASTGWNNSLVAEVMPGDRTATFRLKNGVAVKGGYAGFGEPDPNARDIEAYETTLSGDLRGNDGPDFANNYENSLHVVTGSGTNGTAVLDGFTITAGNANGSSWPADNGGGMYNEDGSPTLTNCIFSGNSAGWSGGGMGNSVNSNSTVTNCTFSGNRAEHGGGMVNYESSPTVTNCTFSNNSAGEGGGMWNDAGNPTVTNCTFSGNSADNGGGMYNVANSNPTLDNCIFSGNSAEWGGGVCNNWYSNPTLTNCTFTSNAATNGDGGGMANWDYSSPTLTNCTFNDNRAGNGGGMGNHTYSPSTLTNCTFTGNSAVWSGGGMGNSFDSSVTLTNCTFNNNSAGAGGGMNNYNNSNSTLTNCTFSDNSAESGGGIQDSESSLTLTNCMFTGNLAQWGGGMNEWEYSSPTLTNCTFIGNSAEETGGGMSNGLYSNPTLANCILWSNTAPSGPQIYNDEMSSATVSYSDVQDGWPGEGNINADPCFVGPKFGEPPEAPIAHWKFDEGQGDIAYDSAGNNDGTIYGAQWTTGQIDGALSFDGLDDYVSLSENVVTTTEFTLMAWANHYDRGGGRDQQNVIFQQRDDPTGDNRSCIALFSETYGDAKAIIRSSNGTAQILLDTKRNYNEWHHYAMTVNSDDFIFYIDGVEVDRQTNNQTGNYVTSIDYVDIGRHRYGNIDFGFFNGTIDDVRAYDRALSAEEVQQFYQMDYHLLPDSPCIDAGDNTAVPPSVVTDLDGKPRIINDTVDMGAYEYANTAPVACIVGGNRIVECGGCWGARVTLDGSGSSDADSAPGTNDDIVSFDWYKVDACDPNFEDFLASGEIIDCNLPLGEHIIVLEVIDKADAFDTNEVTIIVQDTTPPELTLSVSPAVLWPANHKMVLITPSWTASDICDASPEVSLVSITMNEDDEAKGDGHTTLNIQIGDDGSIYLRAERSGAGSGRIYTITYQAVDDSGNVAVARATVTVPHDQR